MAAFKENAALARAAARAAWPGKLSALGHEDDAAAAPDTTPSERVAMVEQLTRDAWAMTRQALPTYPRARMPGRMVRGHDKA